MARVRQWITGFMKRHRDRFKPNDWPDGQDDEESRVFADLWITAFATREVTEAEADEASKSLGETPPNFRREHLQMVVAAIMAMRAQRGVKPGSSTREAVRDESRDCPYCNGNGLTTVWAEMPDAARRIPETAAAYCCCPHGRFIKRTHADKSPELARSIPDLGEVLDGIKRGWLAHPPGCPEWLPREALAELPRQAQDAARAVTKVEIAEMFRPPY